MTEDRNGVPEDAGEEVWVDRDWPRLVVGGLYMILGIVSMSIVAVSVCTFVADLIYPLIDPRIRYQ